MALTRIFYFFPKTYLSNLQLRHRIESLFTYVHASLEARFFSRNRGPYTPDLLTRTEISVSPANAVHKSTCAVLLLCCAGTVFLLIARFRYLIIFLFSGEGEGRQGFIGFSSFEKWKEQISKWNSNFLIDEPYNLVAAGFKAASRAHFHIERKNTS